MEIGGYHPKFFSQNPPPEHLEPWIRKQAMFNLAMAMDLPALEWKNVKVRKENKKVISDQDSTDYLVTVSWKNTGRIPTALDIAQRVKIVQLDMAVLDFDEKLFEGDQPKIKIVDPKSSDKARYTNHLWQNQEASAIFTVRTYATGQIKGKVKVLSTRGGILEKEITLE